MDLSCNIGRHIYKEKAADGPQIKVEDSFLGQVFSSDITECALVMGISGQLVYHGLEVEQVPEEEIVTRSHRLLIISMDRFLEGL